METRPRIGGLMSWACAASAGGRHSAAAEVISRRNLRRIAIEDEVTTLGDLMTGKAGLVHRLGCRLAVVELGKAPAAGRGELRGVLDHELDAVLGLARHGGLRGAEGLRALRQRVVAPGETGDDAAVRIRELALPRSLEG